MSVQSALANFIAASQFPCVMAKAVMSKGYAEHPNIDSANPADAATQILQKIYSFVDHYRADSKTFSSFIVSFTHPVLIEFGKFEEFFWKFLKHLDILDKQAYLPDARVSNNPDASDFSFSIKSEAFFLLVLHPQSQRMARRYAVPTLVFNAHQQFEDLRSKGLFHKVRDLIRKRDTALQGFVNPMAKDFGTQSEVFQYTGKAYPVQSKCPFLRAKTLFKQVLLG